MVQTLLARHHDGESANHSEKCPTKESGGKEDAPRKPPDCGYSLTPIEIKKELEYIWNNIGCLYPHHKAGFSVNDEPFYEWTTKIDFSLKYRRYNPLS